MNSKAAVDSGAGYLKEKKIKGDVFPDGMTLAKNIKRKDFLLLLKTKTGKNFDLKNWPLK